MDHMTYGVDSAAACATSHLRIFMGKEIANMGAVELFERREDRGFDGAIQADGERFGSKQEFDVFFANHEFDDFAQDGHHTRVMYPDAFFQKVDEVDILGKMKIFSVIGESADNLLAFAGNRIGDFAVVF